MTSQNAATHFKNGFDRFAGGDLDGAIAELDRALAIEPSHREALRTLAMAWFKKGDAARAADLARALVDAAPDDALAWSSLSLFLSRSGRIKEAEDAAAKSKLVTWKRELKELKAAPQNAVKPSSPGTLNVLTTPGAPPVQQGPILPTIAKRVTGKDDPPVSPAPPAPPAR